MNILKTLSGKLKKPGSEGSNEYQMTVLGALQGRPIYEGTADHEAKLRRRRANKVARRSRQINRRNK